MSALSTFLLTGPISAVSTLPLPSNNATWGMASTPKIFINSQFSRTSAFTNTKLTRSAYSRSTARRVGAAYRQLGHHGAQKSITVGRPLCPMTDSGDDDRSMDVSICIAVVGWAYCQP